MTIPVKDIIRDARVKAGITQGQLAKKVFVSSPLINRVENGDILPSADTLALIMAALGHKGHDHAILCGCGGESYKMRFDRRVECASCGLLVGRW